MPLPKLPQDVVPSEVKILQVRYQVGAGVNGGTGTSAAWRDRPLNTKPVDEIVGASLASNEITLPAGTYEYDAEAAFYGLNQTQLRFRNTTDNVTVDLGIVAYAIDGAVHTVRGKFTIASPKTFKLQYYSQSSRSNEGLGAGAGFSGSGEDNVFTDIIFRKVA